MPLISLFFQRHKSCLSINSWSRFANKNMSDQPQNKSCGKYIANHYLVQVQKSNQEWPHYSFNCNLSVIFILFRLNNIIFISVQHLNYIITISLSVEYTFMKSTSSLNQSKSKYKSWHKLLWGCIGQSISWQLLPPFAKAHFV